MDQLVARFLAAAERAEEPLIDQLFQAGTRGDGVPKTRGAPAISSAGDCVAFFEGSEDTLLVLREPCAAVADKRFLDENADGFRTTGQTSLVEGGDNGLDIRLAFVKGDLPGRRFASAGRLAEAAFVQLSAKERENRRDGFDLFNWNFFAFLGDEANNALRGLCADDRRQPGVRFVFFADFDTVVAAQLTGLKDGVKGRRTAQGAQLEIVLPRAGR